MTAANSNRRAFSYGPWLAASALILAFAFGMWVLGGRFVFGKGHAERPIWTFLAFYGLGWCGLAMAYAALRHGNAPSLILVLGVALLARGAVLNSNLIQSGDVYRYVLDGENLRHGVNPYRHAPADVKRAAPDYIRSPDAQRILDRVSYPEIRTVYPPLAQTAFAAGATLTPWHWMGQRIVFMVCDVAVIGVLIALLTRLNLPAAWVFLYAWNPFVLKEIANSAHVDSMAALFILAAVYTAVRGYDDERIRWALFCGIAIGAATLTKLFPAILLPMFLGYWFARAQGLRGAVACCGMFAACVVLVYLPFAGVGLDKLTEGFRRYAGEWRRNEGLFAVIAMVAPNHARAVYAVLVSAGALAGAYYVMRRNPSPTGMVAAIQFTLLGWFLLLPAPYPWYATSLLAICVLRPRTWAVVMSGALAAYYYSFIHEYRVHPDAWLGIAQAAEHGIILLAVAVSVVLEFRAARVLRTAPPVVPT